MAYDSVNRPALAPATTVIITLTAAAIAISSQWPSTWLILRSHQADS